MYYGHTTCEDGWVGWAIAERSMTGQMPDQGVSWLRSMAEVGAGGQAADPGGNPSRTVDHDARPVSTTRTFFQCQGASNFETV